MDELYYFNGMEIYGIIVIRQAVASKTCGQISEAKSSFLYRSFSSLNFFCVKMMVLLVIV